MDNSQYQVASVGFRRVAGFSEAVGCGVFAAFFVALIPGFRVDAVACAALLANATPVLDRDSGASTVARRGARLAGGSPSAGSAISRPNKADTSLSASR